MSVEECKFHDDTHTTDEDLAAIAPDHGLSIFPNPNRSYQHSGQSELRRFSLHLQEINVKSGK